MARLVHSTKRPLSTQHSVRHRRCFSQFLALSARFLSVECFALGATSEASSVAIDARSAPHAVPNTKHEASSALTFALDTTYFT
jgi:hypothetical protein